MRSFKSAPVRAVRVAALAAVFPAGAFAVAPSLGSILQQVTPPSAVPAAPGEVVTLPAPTQQQSSSTVQIPVRRLVITQNTLITTAKLHALVQGTEGKTLTLGALNAVVNKITEAYHKAGYPLAFAYLPAQTVRNGVIRIAVVEPKYDQIKVTGASRFKEAQVKRVAQVKPGQMIESDALSRSLLLLNQTPGVQIKGTLIPGAAPQTSTLEIARKDLPILSGSVQIDNTGNPSTGRGLATATVSANNPFGYGSSLSANAVSAIGGQLNAHGVTLISPDYGNGLHFGAYGSVTGYRLGGSFASLNETGASSQAGVDLTFPLVLRPGRLLSLRVDLLNNWNTQSASGAQISASTLPLLRITLGGAYAGAKGAVTTARVVLSNGRVNLTNTSAASADSAGPKTAGSFSVAQLSFGRQQPLPHGFLLDASVTGQLSTKNLDSSQQFFIGGASGVMGAPSGSLGGDEGYLVSLNLSHQLPLQKAPGRLTASLLGQFGGVWSRHSLYSSFTGQNYVSRGSVGAGVTYTWARWTLDMKLVAPFGGTASTSVSPDGLRGWLTLSMQF